MKKSNVQKTKVPDVSKENLRTDLDHRDINAASVVLQIDQYRNLNNPLNSEKVAISNLPDSAGEILRLTVNDDVQISSMQSAFHSQFPYLKIEFFRTPHKIGEGSAKNLLYDENRYIRDCRLKHTNGTLEYTANVTVSEFEERFQRDHGLSVQVFRKSGNVWIETSATDNWTLKQQNQEGYELSHFKAS